MSSDEKACVLECGTSLAEQEYEGKFEPLESILNSSTQSEEGADQLTSGPRPRQGGSPAFQLTELSTAADVNDLRNRLARDVLMQHPSVTTFISPIEDPFSSNPNKHKFLQLPLVYCDQTASNRPVKSIEEYLQRVCLPLYGNTHTNTSITGSQSTAFVAEARQMVAEACNAKITGKASLDTVVFAGQGATSAVQLLIDGLGVRHAKQQPIVFCGPYEHHSNLIPWREAGCKVVMIPEGSDGTVDLEALQIQLQKYEAERDCLKMGTFCAASNVTGKLSDTRAITSLLHKYGTLAFFDYATAAPYIDMDMNPPPLPSESASSIAKDALFMSPHKCFGGGTGTPGVLVCKKHLLSQVNPPERSGGGTVFYVTHNDHRFLSNRLERYEGGTPHVVGIWRTGLVMRLKREVEATYGKVARQNTTNGLLPQSLKEYECLTYQKVATYWRENAPNLVLLGHDETPHLPIFSFLIRCGSRFLHYNYVCAVLNDVFGIQSRGGCQCSGPYSQLLLGLTKLSPDHEEGPSEINRRLEEALVKYKERAELLRPGYTRISLPFKGVSSEEVEYTMRAVAWVAKNAWALMCQYRCNHRTGEWRHYDRQGKPLGREERRWLSHYLSPSDPIPSSDHDPIDANELLDRTMTGADKILQAALSDQKSTKQALKMTTAAEVLDDLEDLRWYVYPQECAEMLASQTGPNSKVSLEGPLDPLRRFESTKARDIAPMATYRKDVSQRKRKVELKETEPSPLRESIPADFTPLGENKKPKNSHHQKPESSSPGDKTLAKKESRSSKTWGMGSTVSLKPGQSPDSAVDVHAGGKKDKSKHQKPPAKLMRLLNQAIFNWDMIENGDRLLLGLSGGKDSLSLLHCLLEFRRKMPINFEVEVCTIDPMTPSFDPSPLIPYVEAMGLKYHYIRDDIVARANSAGKDGKVVSSLCAFCARMKRGNLYSVARKHNCNKLVLAQHLDDCAESFMMSVMHNGFLRTMKAHYTINEGDLAVIRPLVYCRESLMADFAKKSGLPIINENCPACFEEPKERARIKKLLSREELNYPNFYDNIRHSLIPLMHGDMEPILHGYTEQVVAKARRRLVPFQDEKKDEGSDKKERTERSKIVLLEDASDEDLVRELARRKAERHRLAGAMKRLDEADSEKLVAAVTSKAVCTVDGACSLFDD